ncbi:hypothetical protein FQN54_003865 [Arachnomyces sp. PD_36]|nr:hypothetical protein FQN54_003865 [Arachnomyces sp. PD_36]
MVLELHVWGPAFSLPSIDPQCLATIAYFKEAGVPRDQWVLVATSDPSVSPMNELPALKSGSRWISRYHNIVDYLRQYSGGEWDLDDGLSGMEKADCVAFSSFTESQGQPLVDLYLYITSQNYSAGTAPAYASFLQWPNQWILPPRRRGVAKTRTEHLGLSALDLTAIEEERKREHSAAVAAGQVPKSMNLIQRPQQTVTELLGKTSHPNQFRLDAVTAAFLDPLEELLESKRGGKSGQRYFFSDTKASSLDCLVVGYLALALVPSLPYPWFADAMKEKTPSLAAYAQQLQRCFGTVDVEDAFREGANNLSRSSLPWQAPERPSIGRVGMTIFDNICDATPVLKEIRANQRLKQAGMSSEPGLDPKQQRMIVKLADARRRELYTSIVTVTAGLGAMAGYMFHTGLLPLPGRS